MEEQQGAAAHAGDAKGSARHRSLLQAASSDGIPVLGASPASQVFVPACPGLAACNTAEVRADSDVPVFKLLGSSNA